MLTVQINTIDSVAVLTVYGRLDTSGAQVLDQAVNRLPATVRWCVLGAAGVSYLSSAGVRALLRAEQDLNDRGGGQILVGLSAECLRVLEISDLLDHFRRAGNINEAMALATTAPASGKA